MLADSVAYNVAVGTSERARRPRDQKSVTNPERYLIEVYQRLDRPETDFSHVFGDLEGFMFTLTGKHARVVEPASEGNELTVIRQRGWRYPAEDTRAAEYLIREAPGPARRILLRSPPAHRTESHGPQRPLRRLQPVAGRGRRALP